MKRNGTNGFTLIELLIVVAIIAILSAASLAVLITPAKEQALAQVESEMEMGAAVFFSAFVADAHQAASLRPAAANGSAIALAPSRSGAPWVAYFIDSRKNLRRIQTGESQAARILEGTVDAEAVARSAALVPKTSGLKAARNESNGLWTVSISAEQETVGGNVSIRREVETIVGKSWMGGAK